MAPVQEHKSWKDVNKERKEKRKSWREEKLIKKLKMMENENTNSNNESTVKEVKKVKISTLSIAVPGSILENAQSPELRAYLGGQIARAACIFKVNEVIVYDDKADEPEDNKSVVEDADGTKRARNCCLQLARILQYLECPQYLRKFFFPIHQDLKYAGILNPLDAPHHLRQNNDFIFREGVVLNKPVRKGKGSAINIGLLQDVLVDKILTPNVRVTVKLDEVKSGKKLHGTVVPPITPTVESGVYWGYNVRIADSLSQVFTKCPYKKSYGLTIGTSDKGDPIHNFEPMKYKHVLIVFGGLQGIEAALESDSNLNVDDPSLLFDHYLNALPGQGSRTIRTEEAILITLSKLADKLIPKY